MIRFTPEGKEAIDQILHCMKEAQEAFERLTEDEKKACLHHHLDGASINYCIPAGYRAAKEAHQAVHEQYLQRPRGG